MTPVNLDGRRLLTRINGMGMFLDGTDMGQVPKLILDRGKDRELTALVTDLAKTATVAVDIGATFGYFTLLLAKHCPRPCRIFAFEPHPRTFPLLKNSIELNGLDRFCKAYPNPLGAMPSAGNKLGLHQRRFESASFCEAAKNSYGLTNSYETQAMLPLDAVMEANRVQPDLILISTEGYEPEVWTGMARTLALSKPMRILLDYRPKWYDDAPDFCRLIAESGFKVERIFANGLEIQNLGAMPEFRSTVLLNR
jgi:FkbM family methyltransferase